LHKVIIVVHLFGTPADMNQLISITSGINIQIIEDASNAHSAIFMERSADRTVILGYSVEGDKAIAGREGGIVVTNDRNSWIKMSMWGHFDRHAELFGEMTKSGRCYHWPNLGMQGVHNKVLA